MRTRNNTVIITGGDLSPGHEYEIVVQSVSPGGLMQSPDDSPRNTIYLKGKETTPSQPSGLTALGGIVKISLFWNEQTDKDFDIMEVWRNTVDDIDSALMVEELNATTWTDNIGSTGQTRYYWLRARNTSGKTSLYYPETNGVSATTTGVDATNIDDFAVTATKMFTNTVILTADIWTDNSPTPGSTIAWNAHSIVYNGASYPITAGSTALAYIYWTVGNTTYTASATHPTLGNTSFMIAINTAGVHTLVWNSSANMVIGSAFIANAAITNAKIGLLAVTNANINDLSAVKITAGKIQSVLGNSYLDLDTGNFGFGNVAGSGKGITWVQDVGTLNIIGRIRTSLAGARVEIFEDTENGLVVYNSAGGDVLRVKVSGSDSGDLVIGNYAGNKGLKWDDSAATFTVRGALNADDITAGTLSVDRLGAATITAAKLASDVISGGKILAGLLTADNIQTGTLTGRRIQSSASGVRALLDDLNDALGIINADDEDLVSISDSTFIAGLPGMTCSKSGVGGSVVLIDADSGDNSILTHQVLQMTGYIDVGGYVDAATGFKDNGTAGIDKTFSFDDNAGDTHSVIISGGIITQWNVA